MTFKYIWLRKSALILIFLLIAYVGYSLLPLMESIGEFIAKVFYPFILALIFYYLLRPIVQFLKPKMSIYLAITLTFLLFSALVAIIIVYFYPSIKNQINTLAKSSNLPVLKENNVLSVFNYNFYISQELQTWATNFISDTNALLMKGMIVIIEWITAFLVGLVSVPFILFYLLKDDHQIYNRLCLEIPERYSTNLKNFLHEVDLTLVHFINGRLIISLVVSAGLFICFLIIGINYPLLLFLSSFVFYIIPTIGAFIAMIPPLLVGFSMSFSFGLEVFVIMSIASTIEGTLLAPKILGSALYIHPLTVILVLWIAGLLFGVFGLVIATPVYALLKISFRHLRMIL